jgi:hypothetical protein
MCCSRPSADQATLPPRGVDHAVVDHRAIAAGHFLAQLPFMNGSVYGQA